MYGKIPKLEAISSIALVDLMLGCDTPAKVDSSTRSGSTMSARDGIADGGPSCYIKTKAICSQFPEQSCENWWLNECFQPDRNPGTLKFPKPYCRRRPSLPELVLPVQLPPFVLNPSFGVYQSQIDVATPGGGGDAGNEYKFELGNEPCAVVYHCACAENAVAGGPCMRVGDEMNSDAFIQSSRPDGEPCLD